VDVYERQDSRYSLGSVSGEVRTFVLVDMFDDAFPAKEVRGVSGRFRFDERVPFLRLAGESADFD
jgi:hypothetical protein